MVFEEITNEMMEGIFKDLEFFDNNSMLPFERKRIDITLSGKALEILKGKNKSRFIEQQLISA